jgi:hypothetical protein
VDPFGVYESNMIRTHVFVGPFTIKDTRKREETIISGTPDTTMAEEDSEGGRKDNEIVEYETPMVEDEEERQYPTPCEMNVAAPCCEYSRKDPFYILGPSPGALIGV